jgi:hypothetical protein
VPYLHARESPRILALAHGRQGGPGISCETEGARLVTDADGSGAPECEPWPKGDGPSVPGKALGGVVKCEPGQPMLTLVDEEELKERAHLRAPRPTGD